MMLEILWNRDLSKLVIALLCMLNYLGTWKARLIETYGHESVIILTVRKGDEYV